VCALLGAHTASAGEPAPHARILLYHRIGDSRYPTTNTSIEAFRRQMEWLRDSGFTVVSTREIEAFLLEGKKIPPKTVAIHFDDGLRTVYTNAFPILKEFGYPFTVFLPTQAIEERYSDYVTWEMVEEMARARGEFGAHGHTHSRLAAPAKGEGTRDYLKRVSEEFVTSRDFIRRHGLDARWAAYSFGEHGPKLLDAIRESGFKLGFTQDPGAFGLGADPVTLPRYAVVGGMADFDLFRERMGYIPLNVSERWPERGVLPGGSPGRYGVTVADPSRYDPRSANLFVSELGKLDARFDPATGRIEAATRAALKKHFNRVLVTLRDKDTGRFALVSWSIVRNP
jgi:peptidoglycan/xylan/chitin deacetylase (PgdA/CDA1 family)